MDLDEESLLGREGRREVLQEIELYKQKFPTVRVDVEVAAGRASDAALERALRATTMVVARHRGGCVHGDGPRAVGDRGPRARATAWSSSCPATTTT